MSENPLPDSKDVPKPSEQPKTLEEILPEIVNAVPEDRKHAIAQAVVRSVSMRSGPLPDPEELAAYNQIIPNGADRIMKMAEGQSAHRIEIEKIVIKSQQWQGFLGQLFAFLIGVAGLALATYAAIHGQPLFGAAIGGATLVSLVSSFLYSRHAQKRELAQKQQQMNRSQK